MVALDTLALMASQGFQETMEFRDLKETLGHLEDLEAQDNQAIKVFQEKKEVKVLQDLQDYLVIKNHVKLYLD